MNHLSVHILLGILLFAVSCANHEKDTGDEGEMQFTIDASLLGGQIADTVSHFSFQPPIRWNRIPEELFTEASRKIEANRDDDALFSALPLYIFIDSVYSSSLIVSMIRFAEENSDTSGLMRLYGSILQNRSPESEIMYTDFIKDGIRFYQYLLRDDHTINFKLIASGRGDQLLQWDFIVPEAVYAYEIRAIESSIGTIRRIHN